MTGTAHADKRPGMTKLLQEAIAEVELLSDEEQDEIAVYLLTGGEKDSAASCQLSDEQVQEVRRRMTDPSPRFLTLEEFKERMRRLIA